MSNSNTLFIRNVKVEDQVLVTLLKAGVIDVALNYYVMINCPLQT
jgi:hypothetical protein